MRAGASGVTAVTEEVLSSRFSVLSKDQPYLRRAVFD
jgi:hypothetical protein